MGRLILTRPAEAGIGEIDWLGRTLEDVGINFAFSGKSELSKTTLDYLYEFHNSRMLKGTVSILDETAAGVSSDANVDEAYERVQSFHGASVRDRLRQNQTGLIIVGHNVMRAYIKHIERIDTVAALAVDLSIPSIRTYDLSPAGRLITRDITQIPKRG